MNMKNSNIISLEEIKRRLDDAICFANREEEEERRNWGRDAAIAGGGLGAGALGYATIADHPRVALQREIIRGYGKMARRDFGAFMQRNPQIGLTGARISGYGKMARRDIVNLFRKAFTKGK